MTRTIVASLRHRAGRAVALLLGVLVATTAFTVLTGGTETGRLQVTGVVEEHARGSYDLLVRPAGSQTALEEQRGLVQANFLGGQYGGITAEQWRAIARLGAVEVAAPVAMLGYLPAQPIPGELDITDAVDWEAEQQLIEIRPWWLADRGLTTATEPHTVHYVYLTRRPVVWPMWPDPVEDPEQFEALEEQHRHQDSRDWEVPYNDGVLRSGGQCGGNIHDEPVPHEIQSDGETVPICLSVGRYTPAGRDPSSGDSAAGWVVQLDDDGQATVGWPPGFDQPRTGRVVVPYAVPQPLLLLAAIDPAQEAALVGLDEAVVDGRYLAADEPVKPLSSLADFHNPSPEDVVAPALTPAHLAVDEQVQLAARQVTWDGSLFAGQSSRAVFNELATLPRGQAHIGAPTDVGQAAAARPQQWLWGVVWRMQVGPVQVEVDPDGWLRPRALGPLETGGAAEDWDPWQVSPLVQDTAFREVSWNDDPSEHGLGGLRFLEQVGVFDPQQVTGVAGLGRVPLETYLPPQAVGADEASQELLGDQPLLPAATVPAGYLTTPPAALIALETLLAYTDEPAPISAVRVRVAGVTGFDELSRERVRVAAEQVATTTGLAVDIVFGSSPAPQQVVLPAGELGRPELRLAEHWTAKGVALTIIEATDRKSVVLFGLILVVCVLFLANATSAAVRDRRRELAVLACLGWSRWRLGLAIGGEVGLVGLVAGGLAAGLAVLLGRLTGIGVSAGQAWLAVPVALGLVLVAAVVPAWQGSRAHPGSAVQPSAIAPRGRRVRPRQSIPAMAIGNMFRVPGRTLLAVVALAVGVAGLTLLVAVIWAFHGSVTGSLLGDAVSLQVRGVDAVAVVATLLLALVAVADVLYLGVRERAAELAALVATGWSGGAVARLVIYEGLGIGILGAGLGSGAGLAGAAWFAGALPPLMVPATAGVAAGGVLLAGLAALVPAAGQRRAPVALLLAHE